MYNADVESIKILRNKCEIENLLSRKMVIMRLCGAETTYRTANNKLIGARRANETRNNHWYIVGVRC